jgi:hypothetical protein
MGKVERHVLERLEAVSVVESPGGESSHNAYLAEHGCVSIRTLAWSWCEAEPPPSVQESFRRAVRGLRRRGSLEAINGGRELGVRLPDEALRERELGEAILAKARRTERESTQAIRERAFLRIRDAPCPRCRATIGEPCSDSLGRITEAHHCWARRQLAR